MAGLKASGGKQEAPTAAGPGVDFEEADNRRH